MFRRISFPRNYPRRNEVADVISAQIASREEDHFYTKKKKYIYIVGKYVIQKR